MLKKVSSNSVMSLERCIVIGDDTQCKLNWPSSRYTYALIGVVHNSVDTFPNFHFSLHRLLALCLSSYLLLRELHLLTLQSLASPYVPSALCSITACPHSTRPHLTRPHLTRPHLTRFPFDTLSTMAVPETVDITLVPRSDLTIQVIESTGTGPRIFPIHVSKKSLIDGNDYFQAMFLYSWADSAKAVIVIEGYLGHTIELQMKITHSLPTDLSQSVSV